MGLKEWIERPAANVAASERSVSNLVRGAVARFTTPLLPDDYLHLVNPLWSARELRGRIVEVRPPRPPIRPPSSSSPGGASTSATPPASTSVSACTSTDAGTGGPTR